MSAFVVSKTHIDALVRAALQRDGCVGSQFYFYRDGEAQHVTRQNANEVGSILWQENVESVGYRYSPPGRVATYGDDLGQDADPITELPGTYRQETIVEGVAPVETAEWLTPYEYRETRRLEPVAVLKAIDCYEYQSCEHEGWENSWAKAFCDRLRSKMISSLPGYEDAGWGVG